MTFDPELVRAFTDIIVGAGGGLIFAILGYTDYHATQISTNQKSSFDWKYFLAPVIIGSVAGFGILYMNLDAGSLVQIFAMAGFAASGKKITNIIQTIKTQYMDKTPDKKVTQ